MVCIVNFENIIKTRVPQNTYPEHCQWTELNWEFSTVISMHLGTKVLVGASGQTLG